MIPLQASWPVWLLDPLDVLHSWTLVGLEDLSLCCRQEAV